MGEVSTIGLDIAKSVFQIHGVDADGAVVIRKRISRAKLLEFFAALSPCLVGIEACPTTSLEPPTSSARPHREAAASELRESLFEAQQKRRQRRLPPSARRSRGSASMLGTGRVKRAGGWRRSLALARSSRPRWWPR
jgi:hypothetical protein